MYLNEEQQANEEKEFWEDFGRQLNIGDWSDKIYVAFVRDDHTYIICGPALDVLIELDKKLSE